MIKCPKCRAKAYTSTMEVNWITEYEALYYECPKCKILLLKDTIEALKVEV